MMTNYEAHKILGEMQYSYSSNGLSYWNSVKKYIIVQSKKCCNSKFFSQDEFDDFIIESCIMLEELSKKMQREGKAVTKPYIMKSIRNFFINKYNKRRRRYKRIVEQPNLRNLYGEEKYLDMLCEKYMESNINTIEDELTYSPIVNTIEKELNKSIVDVLYFALERGDITPKMYAESRGLKIDAAVKRINRFKKTVSEKMVKWANENKEEANLLLDIFCWITHENSMI